MRGLMAGHGGSGTRYAAFLSYSHKDAAAARWLDRRLESYRMPRRLVGIEGEHGPVPSRLTPIFRDREELPAGNDLSARVRSALTASESLIVVCSAASATSFWVRREIAAFRELHRDRLIYAAIVGGDPPSCFPDGLTANGAEPVAADFRPEGDGRRLGLLKLVAGLSGVGLGTLVQRDSQRRLRRVTAVTAAAIVAMLIMTFLTLFALNARAEAERQRAEAEGLVEFMLTDLRERLEGVGRLDVLTAVNQRAIDYYRHQDLEGLPAASLERRARILHAMGEDDERRGVTARALAQFQEAARTTAALLAAEPDNPDRIFAHAQSEFWVGYFDYSRGNHVAAKPAFERYKRLADRLLEIQPDNVEWLKEAGYAEGNLCSIALAEPVDRQEALRACTAALERMEEASRRSADPSALMADLANRRAWLADAHLANGAVDRAWQDRKAQEQLVLELVRRDPRNMDLQDVEITLYLGLAKVEKQMGRQADAVQHLKKAQALAQRMIRMDPSNSMWRERASRVERDLVALTQN